MWWGRRNDQSYNKRMQQISTEKYKTRHNWVGKVIHWELCKKLNFDHTNKWYMHNQESLLENKTHKLFCDFEIQTDHQISARRLDHIIINKKKKKENLQNCGLWCPSEPHSEIERMWKDGYFDFARELKKLWNMKVTVTPIVIGALGTLTKGLLQGLKDLEIRGRVKTIQTTALLRSARILRRVLETWRDLLSLKIQWETIRQCWCEKLSKKKNKQKNSVPNVDLTWKILCF